MGLCEKESVTDESTFVINEIAKVQWS